MGTPTSRFVAVIGIAVATLLAAIGCQPAATVGLPILTDPGEIVMAGVRSTAALHSVHVRIDLTVQAAGDQQFGGGGGGRQTVDLDIDLATRNFAGRVLMSSPGGPDQVSEMILVGGQQFTRNLPAARWTQFPNFGGQPAFPTNDEVVQAVASTVGSGGVVLHLEDPEPCGAATCYHVIAELDATATWHLIGPVLMGAAGNGPPPPDFNLPLITLHVLVDQATRALVGANTAISFQGTSAAVAVSLTNHDVPLQIVPPNPALVDQIDVNFGGSGIIQGGQATPPSSVESP